MNNFLQIYKPTCFLVRLSIEKFQEFKYFNRLPPNSVW